MAILDLEKAHDCVERESLWIKKVKSDWFEIKRRLKQGCEMFL